MNAIRYPTSTAALRVARGSAVGIHGSCRRPSPPKRQERNERKGNLPKLYFGNAVTTATTLMILTLLGYIGVSVWNRGNIACWGRRTLLLLVFGLVVCCFAAARDGLDKTIQHTIDGSCAPGVFPLVSVPTVVGCAGALLIVVAAIATPIARTQKKNAGALVLCDVRRRGPEDRHHGDRAARVPETARRISWTVKKVRKDFLTSCILAGDLPPYDRKGEEA